MKNSASTLINSNEFRKNDLVRKGGFFFSPRNPKEYAAFSFVPNKALARERPQAP